MVRDSPKARHSLTTRRRIVSGDSTSQMLWAARLAVLAAVTAAAAVLLVSTAAATWLPGAAARSWVRDGSAAEGVIVLVWTAGCLAAGAVRLARSDA